MEKPMISAVGVVRREGEEGEKVKEEMRMEVRLLEGGRGEVREVWPKAWRRWSFGAVQEFL